MAVSNAIGSNIFDIFAGIGLVYFVFFLAPMRNAATWRRRGPPWGGHQQLKREPLKGRLHVPATAHHLHSAAC